LRRGFTIGLAGLLAAGSLTVVPGASAAVSGVDRRGECSEGSNWRLKLSPQDGQIRVEFEVDQDIDGQDWLITLKKNGVKFFGQVRTTDDGGEIKVRRLVSNDPGDDLFNAFARNLETDETCRAMAVAKF
jgi:hypothetical protein